MKRKKIKSRIPMMANTFFSRLVSNNIDTSVLALILPFTTFHIIWSIRWWIGIQKDCSDFFMFNVIKPKVLSKLKMLTLEYRRELV